MLLWLSRQSTSLVRTRSPVRIWLAAPKIPRTQVRGILLFKYSKSGAIFMGITGKYPIVKNVFEYGLIIALAIVMAFNYQLFIVENHYAPAGLNGVATMIQYKTGFSIGYFSLIVNIPLCIIAFFTVAKKYAVRTFCFVACYSVAYIILGNMDISGFKYYANGQNLIFPVILSGIVSGAIYGILFSIQSSTGGTDVISKFVSVKKPEMNFFWVTFSLNLAVAVASFFVYARTDENGKTVYDYLPVCLCVMYCFISSFVGNYFLKGTKKAYEFTVITTHPEEIADRVKTELKHSCTKLTAVGSYTGEKKDILLCVINKHQIYDFKKILSEYDNTFGFSEIVTETYGNFKRIK